MIRHCLLIAFFFLCPISSAQGEYYGSFLFSAPTRSGNLVIWETKYPDPASFGPTRATIGVEAQLYLVERDTSVSLFDLDKMQIMPSADILPVVEEKGASDIGVMFFGGNYPPFSWLDVLKVGETGAKSKYRIVLPTVEKVSFPEGPYYLASLDAWAFVLEKRDDDTPKLPCFENRYLWVVRYDGKVLCEALCHVPTSSSLVGVLVETSDSHIALLMRQFSSEPNAGPRIYAVTFDPSDLSKPATGYYLTDRHRLDADTLTFSCDGKYFSAFHNGPRGSRSLVSVWALSSGQITRITGPRSVLIMPEKSPGARMGWSIPGHHLVFASCNGQTLHLTITDRTLNVVARRAVVANADLSPCKALDCWHYFDREDCLIYHIPPPRPWRIIRYDFKTDKAKVLKNATYGVEKMLKDAKKPSPPTAGK